jgi:hypothetical protein
MEMTPSTLPDKLPLERVDVYLQLETAIAPDTIAGLPLFTSEPEGLVFTSAATIDNGKTAAAFVAGGEIGTTYVVSALCTLASGEIVQPVVSMRVISPAEQAVTRRNVVL